MANTGTLYLIPTPLGEHAAHTLPDYVVGHLHRLDYFLAERARTARRFISSTRPPRPIDELVFFELNKRTSAEELPALLQPARDGHDMGVLSEAGCPGVADPGARIIELAHGEGLQVVPLPGPSSILLALMASGMNGQRFCFLGYLSPKKERLGKELQQLEKESARLGQTQIFMETPYRNNAVVEQALGSLLPKTRFCIAADLTTPEEWIGSRTIAEWKANPPPDLHKRPAIFLLLAGR